MKNDLERLLSHREGIARELAYWLVDWDAFTASALAGTDVSLSIKPIEERARQIVAGGLGLSITDELSRPGERGEG